MRLLRSRLFDSSVRGESGLFNHDHDVVISALQELKVSRRARTFLGFTTGDPSELQQSLRAVISRAAASSPLAQRVAPLSVNLRKHTIGRTRGIGLAKLEKV